jgi:Protein of unknown function (DUF4232)
MLTLSESPEGSPPMSQSVFKASFTFPRAALLAGAAVAASSVLVACASPSASQPADAGQPTASTGQPAPTTAPAATTPAATTPAATTPAATAPAATTPGSAPSSPVAVPSAAPSSGGGAGLAACRSSSLVMTIDRSQANGAAGSTYYPLNFTNSSAKACELYGYPGVSFVTAGSGAGKQVGAAALRSTAFTKLAVRLAPGGSAHAWLTVTVAANYPASTCNPVTTDWLKVYPPEETVAGYVSQTFSACDSASAPLLTILPVRAGKGAVGVTP